MSNDVEQIHIDEGESRKKIQSCLQKIDFDLWIQHSEKYTSKIELLNVQYPDFAEDDIMSDDDTGTLITWKDESRQIAFWYSNDKYNFWINMTDQISKKYCKVRNINSHPCVDSSVFFFHNSDGSTDIRGLPENDKITAENIAKVAKVLVYDYLLNKQ